jgi:crotonobetainyl-CoA:carnitine CoA-transferase CaiB-like acyl-CoA transferase
VKDDIVMASLQGLGADVEHSTTLGQNLPPLIGLTYLWNLPGAERPVGSQLFHPDYFAGIYSAALILAALDHRRRTGSGHFIDSAQAEVAASLLGPWYLACETNERMPRPVGNGGLRGVPAGCFPCKGDDEWCVIIVRDDADWKAFKTAAGSNDWIGQASYNSIIGRLRSRETIEREIGAWTRTQSAPELVQRLQGQGVPSGVVQRVAALLNDGQLGGQRFIRKLDQPQIDRTLVAGVPLTFDGADIDMTEPCPIIGEHTASVLKDWLDLRHDEIAQLEKERVIEIAARAPPPVAGASATVSRRE